MKNDIFSIIFLLSLALSPLSRADLLSDNEASEGPSYHEHWWPSTNGERLRLERISGQLPSKRDGNWKAAAFGQNTPTKKISLHFSALTPEGDGSTNVAYSV